MSSLESQHLYEILFIQKNIEKLSEQNINSVLNLFATSMQVKSATNMNNYVYGNELGKLIASENNDWFLFKEGIDSDPQFDHFTVKDHYEVTFSNGGYSDLIVVDHDIPSDLDDIYPWSPSDTDTSSAVSVTIPWGLEWQFDPNGSVNIDEIGSQSLDYGRWENTPGLFLSALPNPFRFTPGTAWMSSGTYAMMTIRHQGKYLEFVNDPNPNLPSFMFQVLYDY